MKKSKKPDPGKRLDPIATELGTTIKNMTLREKREYDCPRLDDTR
jgi:hypothetical protein